MQVWRKLTVSGSWTQAQARMRTRFQT